MSHKRGFITHIPDESITFLNDSISKNRKEKHYSHSLMLYGVTEHKDMVMVIDSRFYHTASRSYCCVWIKTSDFWLHGGAYAGGYGYHKDSASLEYALISAGIGVQNLEGRGRQPMERALIELAKKLNDKFDMGLSNLTVIHAHG